MKILKFGGTSVGTPGRMHHVAQLLNKDKSRKMVVLSAVSGTTNALVDIGLALNTGNRDEANQLIDQLYQQYLSFYQKLLHEEPELRIGKAIVESHFEFIHHLLDEEFNEQLNKELLAQGELLSTKLFYTYLQEKKIRSELISALDYMVLDENNEPALDAIEEKLQRILMANSGPRIFVTQGFICRNHQKEIDNLKRGGSDYSASIVGAVLKAEEIQIWTDIDGMHNNDPRVVEKTHPIARLSFDEAAELAYFGAKILHPSSIRPAQKYNIPVRLLNTMKPEAQGTLISEEQEQGGIKAIAAKDGITAIKIKSSRMLLAYGFLRKIFEVFEKYKTSIDMITTSEVAVSLTIDDNASLQAITEDLKNYGTIIVDKELSIICIVGDLVATRRGVMNKVFGALEEIPVRMISYGGSRHNISILIESSFKKEALNALNRGLFEGKE